jgi:amidase
VAAAPDEAKGKNLRRKQTMTDTAGGAYRSDAYPSGPFPSDIALWSASALTAALRDRVISSRELLEIYLDRIGRLNPAINAVVTVDADSARRQAQDADRALLRGGPTGALHGLPMTVKDTLETAGMRTTSGAPELTAHVPRRDADGVSRLRAAGAVIFGKTNTATYAGDAQTTNTVFGTTNNPWAPDRSAGGSSGGAAAAIAAGLTGLELGGELSGSARLPAHYCGVYALRPTYGVIPTRGHIPRAPGSLTSNDMVTLAPIARSADDLELGLGALAGPVASEAVGWRLQLPAPRATSLDQYRVGVWLDDPSCPVDDAVGGVLATAVAALRRAGAKVTEVRPVELAQHNRLYEQLLYGAISLGLPQPVFDRNCDASRSLAADDESPAARIMRGSTQRHRAWLMADEQRAQIRARWREFFGAFDVLLCPVSPVAAIKHDHDPDVAARRVLVNGGSRPYWDQIGWTSLATAGALPAAAVPVGLTPTSLPVGIQIVGPHLEDRTVCDLARRLSTLVGGYLAPPATVSGIAVHA